MLFDQKKNQRSGFTFIELLTVIGIIGILAAILIPAGSKVMDSARKTTAANNLRQIALAYNTAVSTSSSGTLAAKDIHSWITKLATASGLDDPRLWQLRDDGKINSYEGKVPVRICKGLNQVDDDFKQCPISFCVASGLRPDSPKSTTPLAWTRGLDSAGKWGSEGVYGTAGGHIVFLDGHVEWFNNLEAGGIIKYNDHTATKNIKESLSPSATILSSK